MYHDVNPEWNYTIFPRSIPKQAKRHEKYILFFGEPLAGTPRL